ncbi:MAG: hypothetical protein CTY12_00550 [Methylotenera sp.]|nr:MAG: hypothetical protein CTY12_00550 [Methylotenera sp.]
MTDSDKSDKYAGLTILSSVVAFIFGLIMFFMIYVDGRNPQWWFILSEVVLFIIAYTSFSSYCNIRNSEQQTIKQTIRLEDTNQIRTRNIIQITTSDNLLFALCDDGTVWSQSNCNPSTWTRRQGIPNN